MEKSNKWTEENNKYWNDNIKNKEYSIVTQMKITTIQLYILLSKQ